MIASASADPSMWPSLADTGSGNGDIAIAGSARRATSSLAAAGKRTPPLVTQPESSAGLSRLHSERNGTPALGAARAALIPAPSSPPY